MGDVRVRAIRDRAATSAIEVRIELP